MHDALYIGATGMQAQQAQVDAIANNLANVNTPGFKRARVSFSDLVVGGQAPDPRAAPEQGMGAQAVAAGVQARTATRVFSSGELKNTGNPMDVAVQGEGFLEVALPEGARGYVRGGTLKVNTDGLLATQAGHPLKPNIFVPENAEALLLSPTGRLQARLPGQATPVELGQLEVVRFPHPQGLVSEGANTYRATDAAGDPAVARPGEEGMGRLAQGFLESSNVRLVEEMVDLMVAQRAYEASVKVVQAADEMLGMINGLRR